MTYATTLTAAQTQAAQAQAQNIANSASAAVGSNTFVFFAAFDGTNKETMGVRLQLKFTFRN